MNILIKTMLLGATLVLASQMAFAEKSNLGQQEFEQNCAICHGLKGKGDGPLAGFLEGRLPDLTKITERNNGVYPFNQIMETIDGRRTYAVHGTKEMPTWGKEYNVEAAEYYFGYRGVYDARAFVRARILALAEYIYELQEKT